MLLILSWISGLHSSTSNSVNFHIPEATLKTIKWENVYLESEGGGLGDTVFLFLKKKYLVFLLHSTVNGGFFFAITVK